MLHTGHECNIVLIIEKLVKNSHEVATFPDNGKFKTGYARHVLSQPRSQSVHVFTLHVYFAWRKFEFGVSS